MGTVLLLVSLLLLVPALILAVEIVAALLRPEGRDETIEGDRPSCAVLIPAHDEASVIDATLESVLEQVAEGDRVVVVADNCSDRTAEIARARGVEVEERENRNLRGKGYALSFGSEHLAQSPPEILVIVDADCQLGPGALDRLVRRAAALSRPVQADYLILPSEPTPRSAVSALALLVRNRVRPLGLRAMGMGCQMTGTGMAFPWAQWRAVPALEGFLVEDLLLGIELTRLGHVPYFERKAEVRSVLPNDPEAQRIQRQRWEQGQLTLLLSLSPRLVVEGMAKGKPALSAAGLDLMVPPLAAWVAITLGWAILSGLGSLVGLGSAAFTVSVAALLLVAVSVFAGWAAHGRELVPVHHLLAVPGYVAWKVPMYITMIYKRTNAWVKTRRDA